MSFFPVQKGFSRASISLLLSIPRAWKFSFSLQVTSLRPFYLTDHRLPWRSRGHENPEGEVPWEHHHVIFTAVCWSLWVLWNPKFPADLTAIVTCSSATSRNIKHIQTSCRVCSHKFFHQTFPKLLAPSAPGNGQLQELPDLFWQLPAQCGPERQCCQQLLVAGKASNRSEVVPVPQLHACSAPNYTQRNPKGPSYKHTHTHKKKRALCVILSKSNWLQRTYSCAELDICLNTSLN